MLMVTDFGCDLHPLRHLKYYGSEARVMENVLANLPSERSCHTYICDQGHSHRIQVGISVPEMVADGVYELTSH